MDLNFKLSLVAAALMVSACSRPGPVANSAAEPEPGPTVAAAAAVIAAPKPPNLQTELTDERYRETSSPIGKFDFKNFTYELPRGWQNPDGTADIKLADGKAAPVKTFTDDKMGEDEKAVAKSQRRIGATLVAVKYFDVTGDGEDEAIVVLKVETGGSAIPQIVYVFTWRDGRPDLLWPFRTGDRADGGLKDLRPANGDLVVELYGQDRFVLGQTETGKITGDLEQLCCPAYFTRSAYKWNGKNFLLQGKRLTFAVADPDAPPVENMGEKANAAAAKNDRKR